MPLIQIFCNGCSQNKNPTEFGKCQKCKEKICHNCLELQQDAVSKLNLMMCPQCKHSSINTLSILEKIKRPQLIGKYV